MFATRPRSIHLYKSSSYKRGDDSKPAALWLFTECTGGRGEGRDARETSNLFGKYPLKVPVFIPILPIVLSEEQHYAIAHDNTGTDTPVVKRGNVNKVVLN